METNTATETTETNMDSNVTNPADEVFQKLWHAAHAAAPAGYVNAELTQASARVLVMDFKRGDVKATARFSDITVVPDHLDEGGNLWRTVQFVGAVSWPAYDTVAAPFALGHAQLVEDVAKFVETVLADFLNPVELLVATKAHLDDIKRDAEVQAVITKLRVILSERVHGMRVGSKRATLGDHDVPVGLYTVPMDDRYGTTKTYRVNVTTSSGFDFERVG